MSPEQLDRLRKFPLLERQLSKGGDGGITLVVVLECLPEEFFGFCDVLLPLVNSKGFVNEGEDVSRSSEERKR